MNGKFETQIYQLLDAEKSARPLRTYEDDIKFLFQAHMGPGHLLSDPERAFRYLLSEMKTLSSDQDKPLTEPLSSQWCRLNLASAAIAGFTPEEIFALMRASAVQPTHRRQDVYDACVRYSADRDDAAVFLSLAEQLLDEEFLPSHSDLYRRTYRPAYRVIQATAPNADAVRVAITSCGTGI